MTVDSVGRSLAAARRWLNAQDAPEALIAECLVRGESEADAALEPELQERGRRWIRRILEAQEPAGCWQGDLLKSASALIAIQEIRRAAGLREVDPGVGRGLDWILARRGVPGAWSDGCSPERHQRGFCHHFAGGFFSPGPPEVPLQDAMLPSGAVARGDAEVRFVASTMALRCLMEWQEPGTDARLQLESIRRVVLAWPEDPPHELGITAFLGGIRTLLLSPDPEDREAAERGLRVLAGKQRGDGSWVETDPFQALEVFATAAFMGVAPERTHRALWSGARLLIATQHEDGFWGGDQTPRRALIACRTLQRVDPGGASPR